MDTIERYLSPNHPTTTIELTLGELRALGTAVSLTRQLLGDTLVVFMPSDAANLAYGRFLEKMTRAMMVVSDEVTPEQLEKILAEQDELSAIYERKTKELLQARDEAILGISIEGPNGERIDPSAFGAEEES